MAQVLSPLIQGALCVSGYAPKTLARKQGDELTEKKKGVRHPALVYKKGDHSPVPFFQLWARRARMTPVAGPGNPKPTRKKFYPN